MKPERWATLCVFKCPKCGSSNLQIALVQAQIRFLLFRKNKEGMFTRRYVTDGWDTNSTNAMPIPVVIECRDCSWKSDGTERIDGYADEFALENIQYRRGERSEKA